MVHRLTFACLFLALAPSAPAQQAPDAPRLPPLPQIDPTAILPPQVQRLPQGRIFIQPVVPVTPDTPPPEIPARDRHFASDVQYAGPIDPLVAALRAPQFEVRQDATTTLLRLSPDRLPEVRSALAAEEDVEASARLMQVAIHLFLKARTPLEGRASLLGIKLNLEPIRIDHRKPDDLRMSVAVAELQPGYPAAQELRVGDRIIAIDGARFPIDMDIDQFRAQVTDRSPGRVLPFSIIRNGKQIEVPVQLAGLPAAGVRDNERALNIERAIDERNLALARFLASLEIGAKSQPLVVTDKSLQSRLDALDTFPVDR